MAESRRILNDSVSDIRITLSCLLVLFVIFKLTGELDWPWLWVLSPFWIPACIALIYIGVLYSVLFAVTRTRRRLRK